MTSTCCPVASSTPRPCPSSVSASSLGSGVRQQDGPGVTSSPGPPRMWGWPWQESWAGPRACPGSLSWEPPSLGQRERGRKPPRSRACEPVCPCGSERVWVWYVSKRAVWMGTCRCAGKCMCVCVLEQGPDSCCMDGGPACGLASLPLPTAPLPWGWGLPCPSRYLRPPGLWGLLLCLCLSSVSPSLPPSWPPGLTACPALGS